MEEISQYRIHIIMSLSDWRHSSTILFNSSFRILLLDNVCKHKIFSSYIEIKFKLSYMR
jgi:hypothetical protein